MADVQYLQLRTQYQGGFVFLAYVVAVVGAWTTIELLLRRTGGRGSYNIGLLIGAGVAFGSTATWGMHFVSGTRPAEAGARADLYPAVV
jgi:NO-binding membrane sensor protein with MHYT domain